MKTLVLFSLIVLPTFSVAQTVPTVPSQPESTGARIASNVPDSSGVDGRVNSSRATATSAMAMRATTPPVLDGKTDDPAWRDAQVIDLMTRLRESLDHGKKPGAVRSHPRGAAARERTPAKEAKTARRKRRKSA